MHRFYEPPAISLNSVETEKLIDERDELEELKSMLKKVNDELEATLVDYQRCKNELQECKSKLKDLETKSQTEFNLFKTRNDLLPDENMIAKIKWQSKTIRIITQQRQYWKKLAEPTLDPKLKYIWKELKELLKADTNETLGLVEKLVRSRHSLEVKSLQYDLIDSQISYYSRNPQKKYVGLAHYSEDLKIYWTNYFGRYGSAYTALSQIIRIPHVRSQQKTISSVKLSIGFDKERISEVARSFKEKTKEAPHLLGVLSVDATDIQYPMIQRNNGKISGSVDYGGMENALGMDILSIHDLEAELNSLEFTVTNYITDLGTRSLYLPDFLPFIEGLITTIQTKSNDIENRAIVILESIVSYEDDSTIHKNALIFQKYLIKLESRIKIEWKGVKI